MASGDHTAAIARAAREILRPFGCTQKGRSRIWYDDRGWWVGHVEFQPSGFSKGSYLNVAASWLWHPEFSPLLSFDDFADGGQHWRSVIPGVPFDAAARDLALEARTRLEQLRERHATLERTADRLALVVKSSQRVSSWQWYDAGVACGLAGRSDAARHFLGAAIQPDEGIEWRAKLNEASTRLRDLVGRPEFRDRILERMHATRTAARLPPIEDLDSRLALRGQA